MNPAARLFERHHLGVFRYFRAATRSTSRAEDLTQEVFLRVVRALPRYRAEEREESWIFTIARNALLNERRARARSVAVADLEEGDRPTRVPVIGRIDLARALLRLDPLDRDVFLLREVGGLTYDEAAQACEITPNAVRSRIYRTRLALRSALARSPRRANQLRKEFES